MSQDSTHLEPESEREAEERLSSRDLLAVAACNVCGSRELTWHCQAQNRGGVQDGRIKMNEVGVIFFLGCDECSETVRIIDGDVVAVALTASLSANVRCAPTGAIERLLKWN